MILPSRHRLLTALESADPCVVLWNPLTPSTRIPSSFLSRKSFGIDSSRRLDSATSRFGIGVPSRSVRPAQGGRGFPRQSRPRRTVAQRACSSSPSRRRTLSGPTPFEGPPRCNMSPCVSIRESEFMFSISRSDLSDGGSKRPDTCSKAALTVLILHRFDWSESNLGRHPAGLSRPAGWPAIWRLRPCRIAACFAGSLATPTLQGLHC